MNSFFAGGGKGERGWMSRQAGLHRIRNGPVVPNQSKQKNCGSHWYFQGNVMTPNEIPAFLFLKLFFVNN